MQEKWKDIKGFEGLYEVSDFGNVRNKKTKRLFEVDVTNSYAKVALSKECKRLKRYVHRVVYESHIGPLVEGYQINHKDFNRLNNHVSNLEQVTVFENNLHSRDRNFFKIDFKMAKKMRESNLNSRELSEFYDLNDRQIRRVLNNEAWFDPEYNPEDRKTRIKNLKMSIKQSQYRAKPQ